MIEIALNMLLLFTHRICLETVKINDYGFVIYSLFSIMCTGERVLCSDRRRSDNIRGDNIVMCQIHHDRVVKHRWFGHDYSFH